MSYAAGPVHFTIDTYADWDVTLTWYTNAAKTCLLYTSDAADE